MTQFEKDFLFGCLNHMVQTFSTPEGFNSGSLIFQNQETKIKHTINKLIGQENWSTEERCGLAYAVYSAIAFTEYQLIDGRSRHNEEANKAIAQLMNDYLPRIIKGTSSENRLQQLHNNCMSERRSVELEPTPSTASTAYSAFKDNPIVFFAKTALVAVTAGALASLGMSQTANHK